ncbi:MAG: hypothetical protein FWD59_00495, partial [Micrococcales bacterium]|nr:hypothetical protein [Micrococcales bacterium]
MRAAPVFAAADTVRVAPLTPELGETVSQDWFDDADHEASPVVTTTPVEAILDHTDQVGIDTDTTAGAWVTATVELAAPALKVTIPDRDDDEGLAWTDTVAIVPSEPEIGATVSHGWF